MNKNNGAQGAIEKPFRKRLAKNTIAQGAIEYLLIIGAAILVVTIVAITMSGIVGTGTENNDSESTYDKLLEIQAEDAGKYFIPLGTSEKYIYTGNSTTLTIEILENNGQNIEICTEETCENSTIVHNGDLLVITPIDGHGTIPKIDLLLVTNEISSFSIAILPDTQKYVLNQSHPEIFDSQTSWIAQQKNLKNIKFVIHEGDIVDTWNNVQEWIDVDHSLSILENANIPYSVIPGNHEHENWSPVGDSSFYEFYFPASRFSSESWWGGSYNNNTNNYQKIDVLGKELLFLNLDFCPDENEIAWGNSVLNSESYDLAFFTTHGFLNTNAERNAYACDSTQYIWDDLIKKHENLRFVFSGHMHGEARRTDPNDFGQDVYQILANYQTWENGGNGYLRLLTFIPDKSLVKVQTYSPYLGEYILENSSNFDLNFNFNN